MWMMETPTAQPAPMVPATPLDLYLRHLEIRESLAVIHEQLKTIPDHEQRIRRLEASRAKLETIRDHEQRIRRLEASRAKLAGVVVAFAAIMSGLGTWLGLVLTRH
jgi:hypothetical protein